MDLSHLEKKIHYESILFSQVLQIFEGQLTYSQQVWARALRWGKIRNHNMLMAVTKWDLQLIV